MLNNRIHWAKFYMVKAGLIDQPRRGRFIASDKGRALLAHNPSTIDVDTLLEYPAFHDFYRGGHSDIQDEQTVQGPASAV